MPMRRESRGHVFGRPRPSETGKFPLSITPKRDTHFRPLPKPPGKDPYQLDLKTILPPADYQKIVQKKKLAFHLNGDMGGIKYAVPQELAATLPIGELSNQVGTLVKLVRVTMLAPFMIALILIYARQRRNSGEKQTAVTVHYSRLVPPFVWGFLAVALLNTASLIPTLQFHVAPWVIGGARDFTLSTTSLLSQVEAILLTLAMAAMGLEVSVRRLAKVGGPAILTGLAATVIVCLASLALIKALL